MATEEMTGGATPSALPPVVGPARGTTIGRFIVLGTLGAGGMGVVVQAFDPWLDRKVAIKLLRPRLDDDELSEKRTARLLREAQAMARIAHRNVITVHDVGVFEEQVFIAMEHIDGETLSGWLGTRRGWREVAAIFALAARGLEAAHALGLVHRDFKPDNVLVARDGRVLVTDFGVVGVAAAPAGEPGAAPPVGGLTSGSTIVGTPLYMAPEQRDGLPVDGRADQYSLCVALSRALGRGAPRRLQRAVQRGLSPDPAARFPTIGALAEVLERDRRGPTRLAVAAGFAVALLAVLAARRDAPACGGLETRLAGVWDPARRAAVEHAFRASARPYAADALRAVVAGLDAWADGWTRMRIDACQATRVRGDQSEELLDLRVECLDARRSEARALVDVLAQADDATVERGAHAVAGLERLDGCANTALLRAPVRPPASPALAVAVAEVRARLAVVNALRLAGHYPDALQHARAATVAAHGLGFLPLVADAEWSLGVALTSSSDLPGARRALLAAAAAADGSRRDDLRARALLQIYTTLAGTERKVDEAEPYHRLAAAVIARVGEREDPGRELAARLLRGEAQASFSAGRYDEAIARNRAAFAAWQRIDPTSLELPAIRHNMADAEGELGRLPEALADARAALELRERALGPRHPSLSAYHLGLNKALMAVGDLRGARAAGERALELAPSDVQRASALQNLAATDNLLGDHDRAAAEAREAAALAEKTFGPDSARVGEALTNLISAQQGAGDLEGALATARRVLAIHERAQGPRHVSVAMALNNVAFLELALGRVDDAARGLARARELLEETSQPDYLANVLVNLGWVALRRGRPADANAPASRARELALSTHNADTAAEATWVLAQALAAAEPARARAFAAEARDRYAALAGAAKQRAEVDAWLARH